MTTATLRNWGGSVALPIPKAILNLVALQSGSAVTLQVERGRIIVAPEAPRHSLERLMAEQRALKLAVDSEWVDFAPLPSEQA